MRDAFDFEAIGGGIAGSCLMYGIKRGLYSNEAGVGSAPNAAAAAHVSHPVKQGLAQVISVYIDTLFLCTAYYVYDPDQDAEHPLLYAYTEQNIENDLGFNYNVDGSEPIDLYAVWQVDVHYHLNETEATYGGS